ncbi:MAG: diaminopimelate epimerase [Planctomycetes bacterium]|nr:diaminopimelate epimerase [Planctomycetota bacterium]
MKRVRFRKMEGAGNDYVFVDGIRDPFPMARGPELAQRWSDRHFGIGGDGLIVLLRDPQAPVRMAMWNADGSRGAMCGNGLRCLAKLAAAHGHVTGPRFVVETDAGLRPVELLASGDVRTELGTVTVAAPRRITVDDRSIELWPGDAGNPHAVTFVADTEQADVLRLGEALQHHPDFPGGVNVEFVQVLGPLRLRQRTYERGSGETLACGTGAAVAASAARAAGLVGSLGDVQVELRGGTLRVQDDVGGLAIVGPARTVFTGEIELSE